MQGRGNPISREETNTKKSEERRSELLGIALELFAKFGYHNTKISDIVKQAGVAQGTFYWHFKSKEAIALEIIASGRAEIAKVIGQGYRSHSGTVEDMVTASELLLTSLFRFAGSNRYFMELLYAGAGNDEVIRSAVNETRNEMERAFRRNIERAVELQMLPANIDSSLRAMLLVSLIEGVISRWLFGPRETESELSRKTAEELAAETARFEFFGLLGTTKNTANEVKKGSSK
ncbi:TetR/AcrR family transcriptional regulator [Paenibacillus sonchi]|uniref:TetR/AcrR family transcriptional regulator n=1 Tax=Paenibacillus sonchi TaxID=373687 RepID=A0A974SF91_9BACL|nr:TetR/AcrR family transcriptional regulator [Paenibacillus sonchi]QQZ64363.1 TetR/AcrR family transcriptional regulator [Paenibacillus sonchi]